MSFNIGQINILNSDGIVLGSSGKNSCILSAGTGAGGTTSRTITFPETNDKLVGQNTNDVLTNKTLTSPTISTIKNTGVLTLPTETDTLVGKNTTDVLTNKTLTSPTISTIKNTGVLTLPTETDTLVGKNTTDILTNKTLTSPTISTIKNTGILTLPTETDTLVGKNTTDVLTNKTLTSPTISTIKNTGVLTLPTETDTLVGKNTTDVLTNKTLTGTTNNIEANKLGQGANSVVLSGQAVAGSTIIATDSKNATWKYVNLPMPYMTGSVATTTSTNTTILSLPTKDNTSYCLNINVVSRSDKGITYGASITSVYMRGVKEDSLKIVQNDAITVLGDKLSKPWKVFTSANTTTGNIDLVCTGENKVNINWSAVCYYISV